MARWKLTEPHYLNVPSSRWEQISTDPRTGKPVRKMYKVPMHLDPRVEDDWNYEINGMDGEIHVCYAGKGLPHDIVFEGNPTPGMVPLDDEAAEITSRFDWTPTQGTDEESQRAGFYARLGDSLIDKMTELKAAQATAPQNSGVEKLMEAIAAMMQQNQQIMQMLTENSIRVANPVDQVVDEEEPLPIAAPTEEEIAEATVAAAAKEAASNAKAAAHVSSRRL